MNRINFFNYFCFFVYFLMISSTTNYLEANNSKVGIAIEINNFNNFNDYQFSICFENEGEDVAEFTWSPEDLYNRGKNANHRADLIVFDSKSKKADILKNNPYHLLFSRRAKVQLKPGESIAFEYEISMLFGKEIMKHDKIRIKYRNSEISSNSITSKTVPNNVVTSELKLPYIPDNFRPVASKVHSSDDIHDPKKCYNSVVYQFSKKIRNAKKKNSNTLNYKEIYDILLKEIGNQDSDKIPLIIASNNCNIKSKNRVEELEYRLLVNFDNFRLKDEKKSLILDYEFVFDPETGGISVSFPVTSKKKEKLEDYFNIQFNSFSHLVTFVEEYFEESISEDTYLNEKNKLEANRSKLSSYTKKKSN